MGSLPATYARLYAGLALSTEISTNSYGSSRQKARYTESVRPHHLGHTQAICPRHVSPICQVRLFKALPRKQQHLSILAQVAPQDRLDAVNHQTQREWLGDVIVCAHVEVREHLRICRQKYHWHV